ncbi:hypothetical protein V6N13_139859 [Hibiscus sabdariffa]|uniref:Uncharacterized protein n=2 Tax=Hibiscus sabdariffa TaxID=183260 RepID=A0ABR2QBY3_9ROSI
MPLSSDAPSKRTSTSNAKSERSSKPKLAPASGKAAKIEEEKGFDDNSMKTISEAEPRRSNRRIQPTSRYAYGSCLLSTALGRPTKLIAHLENSLCFTRQKSQKSKQE